MVAVGVGEDQPGHIFRGQAQVGQLGQHQGGGAAHAHLEQGGLAMIPDQVQAQVVLTQTPKVGAQLTWRD